MQRISRTDILRFKFLFSSFSAAAKEAGTDNRNIVDDGKSQKLTRDDIEMLKEQGLKGQVQPLSSTYLKLTTMFNVQIQQ